MEREMDERSLAHTGEFNFKRFDFIETSLAEEPHETFEDIVEQKIFKFKYRQNNDDYATYSRR
jgi:hypothetical protein